LPLKRFEISRKIYESFVNDKGNDYTDLLILILIYTSNVELEKGMLMNSHHSLKDAKDRLTVYFDIGFRKRHYENKGRREAGTHNNSNCVA
jgi:hypothetical protein